MVATQIGSRDKNKAPVFELELYQPIRLKESKFRFNSQAFLPDNFYNISTFEIVEKYRRVAPCIIT